MTTLRERKVWRRESSKPAKRRRFGSLSAEEQANVRRAIHVLRIRFGSNARLARAIRMNADALQHAAVPSRRPSARLAMLVARVADVPIGDVLPGAWPKPGACPMCGRS